MWEEGKEGPSWAWDAGGMLALLSSGYKHLPQAEPKGPAANLG